jgi:hypothetical protein
MEVVEEEEEEEERCENMTGLRMTFFFFLILF